MVTEADMRHLRRCVELAHEAFDKGEEPFGSVLATADGTKLAEDHNRTSGGDQTLHPEFELARWAANNMTPQDRAGATVYTSGEHCPMCSAAHAWVGLGRIVYVVSAAQLTGWRDGWGAPSAPVRPYPIQEVAPGVIVGGPVPQFEDEMKALHRRTFERG
ncbi:nucleoside deaminase [Herbidospora mongoliensis]|uniref:nucleoside deaminase n=1 Tax=Herbidospora mongoliensis TaxID=688067 RepID=UPI00082A1334|nr:nucleoside deaminase [Herbidospora mongoliensis]